MRTLLFLRLKMERICVTEEFDSGHSPVETGHWEVEMGHSNSDSGHSPVETGHWEAKTGHSSKKPKLLPHSSFFKAFE